MIPENKIKLVESAVGTAFGTTKLENIEKITTGLSGALVFRIEIKGKAYLLRIITRTDAMADPTNHFKHMTAAANAGIAPKIKYLSVEDRISITDFIESKPFPQKEARAKMPKLLKKLHGLPTFHSVMNVFDMAHLYLQKVKTLNLLPEPEMLHIMAFLAQITSAYKADTEDFVSCHNDLKPENIIYDGQRPWIVDWEAAFLNNKYADLSIVANFVIQTEEEEIDFLSNYLGKHPTEAEAARFYLTQQAVHINYFAVFISILSTTKNPIDLNDRSALSFKEFHDQLWKGKITLAEDAPRLHYALLHKEKFQENTRSKRYKDAIELLLSLNRN